MDWKQAWGLESCPPSTMCHMCISVSLDVVHAEFMHCCHVQINKLVTRAFRNLKADEVLNFSVAVTVMRVQRKWRARMRAAKMKRKKEVRVQAAGPSLIR